MQNISRRPSHVSVYCSVPVLTLAAAMAWPFTVAQAKSDSERPKILIVDQPINSAIEIGHYWDGR